VYRRGPHHPLLPGHPGVPADRDRGEDFPGLDLGPYQEVLGGLHHIAISVTRESWLHLRDKLEAAGVEYQMESGSSIYLRDPDGARLELISDPLGEMYGLTVL
jgi:catechol 2,3-dioxygenase-like lactoylglutathione lyase family enzyme